MNFSGVRLDMSFKEAQELHEILERDKAMPIVVHEFENEGRKFTYHSCPKCKENILGDSKFCQYCGQRIDAENKAI